MNIDTIQCKRITSDWDNKKSYIPKLGEMVFVSCKLATTDAQPTTFFVIGTGNSSDTVWALYSSKRYFSVTAALEAAMTTKDTTLENSLNNALTSAITNLRPAPTSSGDNKSPELSTKDNCDNYSNTWGGRIGDSTYFARADHSHPENERHLLDIMNVNEDTKEYHCRRIRATTSIPTSSDAGQRGDIWVVY